MDPAVTLPIFTSLLFMVGAMRLGELALSRRNRRHLSARGAAPVREPHFGAMVMLHVAVLAGAAGEAWLTRRTPSTVLMTSMLAVVACATVLRWWVIVTLGPHWNVAVMNSIAGEGAVVTHGPFRWIRHPNYVAVFVELLALPLVHAAWLTALAGAAAHVWVLHHRIRVEESVLLEHPLYRATMALRPRFVPQPVLAALAGAWALVRLGRPVFLTGGMVLYALGAVAAARGHAIERGLLVLGLGAVLALQLMTHYANEYFDYRADLANRTPTRWSGGSRVLAAGELPRWVALAAALMAAGAGLVLTLTVAQAAGPLPATLLAAIALLAWCYSAPPLRLHSTGLGELDGALVVAVLVPLFAFFLHAPNGGPRPLLLALVPPACLQFAMLVAVAIPDAASDAAAGKRTLAVRLGIRRAWQVHASATLAAYALLPFLHAAGLPARVALAAALPAPLALWHVASRRDGRALDPESWESLTFWSAALLALTAAAEAVGFLG